MRSIARFLGAPNLPADKLKSRALFIAARYDSSGSVFAAAGDSRAVREDAPAEDPSSLWMTPRTPSFFSKQTSARA